MKFLGRNRSDGAATASGLARSARAFWRWWVGEIVGLLPRHLRQMFSASGSSIGLRMGPNRLEIARRSEGFETAPIRLDLSQVSDAARRDAVASAIARVRKSRRDPMTILLSENDATRTAMSLPAAARENLREVIGFEMDRHTPFRADEVYYDHRVLGTESDPPSVVVEVGLAPRDVVDRALADAKSWGLEPTAVGLVSDANDPGKEFLLLSDRPAQSGSRFLRSFNLLLAVAAIVLGALVVYLPLDRLQRESDRLSARIDTLQREAKEGASLRTQMETLRNERRFGVNRKLESPPVVITLDRLTGLLPKHSWVFQFQMTGKEVQIQGYSPDAARLVGLIENARQFRNAGFRSRVTRAPNSDAQRFHISFDALPVP